MTVMLVGGGGREAAIAYYIKKNSKVKKLYCLPGNAGTAMHGENVDISTTDIDGIVDFAVQNGVEYAIVAPDDPLVMGAVDRLQQKGVRCFGPSAAAAIVEGSKAFSKAFMERHNIPTARFRVFESAQDAIDDIRKTGTYPTVIKADGLALGKGVIIAKDEQEATQAINSIMNDRIFGESGARVVVEEFLTGPEISVLCLTDGKTIVPLPSAMDYKRIGDGNTGGNTGGMGTIAPNPHYTEQLAQRCMREIFEPTIKGLIHEGRTFKGCLYFGLMLTAKGPKVIEYNCRFGDPETQVVLPLLDFDLFDAFLAVTDGKLSRGNYKFKDGNVCCVVLASGGYPGKYATGCPITDDGASDMQDVQVFYAGAKHGSEQLLTSGGRVLGVSAHGNSAHEAREKAYKASELIKFDGVYKRTDIGKTN